MGMYDATRAQRAYFGKLTGENLPYPCSKSKASAMIQKALKGTYVAPKKDVRVCAYQIHDWSGLRPGVTWEILVDHYPLSNRFDTQEAAVRYAELHYGPGNFAVSDGVRTISVD